MTSRTLHKYTNRSRPVSVLISPANMSVSVAKYNLFIFFYLLALSQRIYFNIRTETKTDDGGMMCLIADGKAEEEPYEGKQHIPKANKSLATLNLGASQLMLFL